MGAIKIKGETSGSTTIVAPATGSDVTMTLPGSSLDLGTELASKLPIAGGKILQIVRATDATDRTTTSTSFVDASISVTITPQKNDSAILLIWSFVGGKNAANEFLRFIITDSANNVVSGAQAGLLGSTNATLLYAQLSVFAYATPNTTSATTYKVRFRSDQGNSVIIQNTESTGQMFAIEVSA